MLLALEISFVGSGDTSFSFLQQQQNANSPNTPATTRTTATQIAMITTVESGFELLFQSMPGVMKVVDLVEDRVEGLIEVRRVVDVVVAVVVRGVIGVVDRGEQAYRLKRDKVTAL